MFILKKGHQPGVYVPLRALFLVISCLNLLFPVFCISYAQLSQCPIHSCLYVSSQLPRHIHSCLNVLLTAAYMSLHSCLIVIFTAVSMSYSQLPICLFTAASMSYSQLPICPIHSCLNVLFTAASMSYSQLPQCPIHSCLSSQIYRYVLFTADCAIFTTVAMSYLQLISCLFHTCLHILFTAVCPSGQEYVEATDECVPCPVGKYKPDSDRFGMCANCTEGFTTEGEGKTSITDCNISEYLMI